MRRHCLLLLALSILWAEPALPDDATGWLQGLDQSDEQILTIPAAVVAAAVPCYRPKYDAYVDDLRLRLLSISEVERERYLDPAHFSDAWYGDGDYEDRVIEQDAIGYWRVFRAMEYPYYWQVFAMKPEGQDLPEDVFSFWIAGCLSGDSPLTQSGRLAFCKSYLLDGDLALNFTVSEQNLGCIEQVRDFLRRELSSWTGGR